MLHPLHSLLDTFLDWLRWPEWWVVALLPSLHDLLPVAAIRFVDLQAFLLCCSCQEEHTLQGPCALQNLLTSAWPTSQLLPLVVPFHPYALPAFWPRVLFGHIRCGVQGTYPVDWTSPWGQTRLTLAPAIRSLGVRWLSWYYFRKHDCQHSPWHCPSGQVSQLISIWLRKNKFKSFSSPLHFTHHQQNNTLPAGG